MADTTLLAYRGAENVRKNAQRRTTAASNLLILRPQVVCGKQNNEYPATVGQPILAAAGFQPAFRGGADVPAKSAGFRPR
jgi:hypothetical protein